METSGWERKTRPDQLKKLQTKDCASTCFELSEGDFKTLLAPHPYFQLLAAIER